MNLDQGIDRKIVRQSDQSRQHLVLENRHDQEHRVGPGDPRFIKLIRVEDKVFPEQRKINLPTNRFEMLQRAAKEIFFAEHRQRRRAAKGVTLCNTNRIEVFADNSF